MNTKKPSNAIEYIWASVQSRSRTTSVMLLEDMLTVACLESGLRWLNDRSQDDKRRNKSRAWQDPSGRWFG